MDNINCLLFIAVVLNLRYKLDYVNYCLGMIYDPITASKMSKKINETLHRLLSFYGGDTSNENEDGVHAAQDIASNQNNLLSHYLKHWGGIAEKNDLEKYLLDENVNPMGENFDILAWWKVNSDKFKVLSQIARDVLAVPVSTVASESAFSTGGRILDPFRSSLSAKMVEALVCAQNWLRSSHEGIQPREYMNEDQAFEDLLSGNMQ